ncbi:hypothetical protein Lal_00031513 [Lupinus albus]|nr:hypothetical protein Lal_00031513 [Lupinus albus]
MIGKGSMISLGRGFYDFSFSSLENMKVENKSKKASQAGKCKPIKESELFINLEIKNMETLKLDELERVGNPTSDLTPIVHTSPTILENPTEKVNQDALPNLMENVIISYQTANALVANDMEIVGRLWADRDDEEDSEEEITESKKKGILKESNLPVRVGTKTILNENNGNLINLPTRGVDFTWSNRRRGVALTEKRLDKSLCNEDWLIAWKQVSCCSLPRLPFDHHHLMLCSSSTDSIIKSSFRLHKMWLHNLDCKRVVSEAWRVVVHGCPMFVLSQKLRMLKKDLRYLNINVFGDVHQRVKNAYNAVEVIQLCINESGSDAKLLTQENLAQKDLLQDLIMKDTFLMEKARLK